MHQLELIEITDPDCLGQIINAVNDGIYILNNDRVITYWNKTAENITGYRASQVVGSKCRDNILVHIDENGRYLCESATCPAYNTIQTGKTNYAERVYLHHQIGHRIPVCVYTAPIRNEDGSIAGAVEIFSEYKSKEKLQVELEDLQKLVLLDPLTNTGNRRFGQMKLQTCISQFARYKWPFGVLFCDIDNFKKINDDFGHDCGDRILKMVAQTLASNVRSLDYVIRWGGEEFVVIAANIKAEHLQKTAEKLRILVENSSIFHDSDIINVTISIGATCCINDDNADSIVQRADNLMYKSKQKGKNRISFE